MNLFLCPIATIVSETFAHNHVLIQTNNVLPFPWRGKAGRGVITCTGIHRYSPCPRVEFSMCFGLKLGMKLDIK